MTLLCYLKLLKESKIWSIEMKSWVQVHNTALHYDNSNTYRYNAVL